MKMWIGNQPGGVAVDQYEMKKRIQGYVNEICHYGQMQVFATSYYQKNFFQRQIDGVTEQLICFCLEHSIPGLREQQADGQEEAIAQSQAEAGSATGESGRTFTMEDLAFYDGSSGRPAYVAVNDIVYDVTALIRWAGGTHFGVYAGKDLSIPFNECHQGAMDVLKNAAKIGTLIK